jgi:hypothetical protein
MYAKKYTLYVEGMRRLNLKTLASLEMLEAAEEHDHADEELVRA